MVSKMVGLLRKSHLEMDDNWGVPLRETATLCMLRIICRHLWPTPKVPWPKPHQIAVGATAEPRRWRRSPKSFDLQYENIHMHLYYTSYDHIIHRCIHNYIYIHNQKYTYVYIYRERDTRYVYIYIYIL